MQLILWRISICVLVVYKYMYRNSYFTIMAAVEYKIYQLYAEKYDNILIQKCASYFRQINHSYSNCRVCKSFTGLQKYLRFISYVVYTLFGAQQYCVVNILCLYLVYLQEQTGVADARLRQEQRLSPRRLSG
jgi:hypothetical protein